MKELLRVVIIDDNPSSLELLAAALEDRGLSLHTADDPHKGLALIRELKPQLVITDLVMPGMTGMEVLDQIMSFAPTTEVVLMTAHYTTETAVEAIQKGAADYWQKPVKIARLRERVAQLLEVAQKRARAVLSASAISDFQFEGMQARSASMWKLFELIDKVAPHFRSVLIHGPTGSGKDLVARALHQRSRAKGPFVVVNCSAIVETLFESELFGHTRGAFTGADRDKIGLFAAANGGTLFLDEIGDMPLASQAKLLRAIQNQEVYRIGSTVPTRVDVKVVAATHRDLKQSVKTGHFREDLYYRLSMVELEVPALKDRPEDVELLCTSFLRGFAESFHKEVRTFTPRALVVLKRYAWPGNVRQLEHAVGRACMLAEGSKIDVDDLPVDIRSEDPLTEQANSNPSPLDDLEKNLVERVFYETRGNQSEAARRLGIGRDALRYKIKKFGIRLVD
ncbi:sigma-54-dependent transcriptional regulator [Terriglobus sp. ADX1]|uniref:sigma-54-dependent transcriptional regulator n=1 Tax=Terriglobus sp. ADX1 TaxID=2794063 RepID=UPI002FE51507